MHACCMYVLIYVCDIICMNRIHAHTHTYVAFTINGRGGQNAHGWGKTRPPVRYAPEKVGRFAPYGYIFLIK